MFAKWAFIFSNDNSFFTFLIPLPCLADHILLDLIVSGQPGYKMPVQVIVKAAACFEISTDKSG